MTNRGVRANENENECFQVCDEGLQTMRQKDSGALVAVGSLHGHISLIRVSEALLHITKNDRSSLTSVCPIPDLPRAFHFRFRKYAG